MRERRPGVWEIPVVVDVDERTGVSVQQSSTVHGDTQRALQRRAELVAGDGACRQSVVSAAGRMTVGELLDLFVTAPQAWKPATRSLHRYVVKSLATDPLCRSRLVVATAGSVQTAIGRWQESGASIATVSGRWLVLRSALSWAVRERLFTVNPLLGIRGPARPAPTHLSLVEVRQ
jgi:hypothetical protein